MIQVEIFTHSMVGGSIYFEEGDLRITFISGHEFISKSDFDKLLDAVMDIETKDLKPEEWYSFSFKRNWEYDGSGLYKQCWFELIETSLIEIEL